MQLSGPQLAQVQEALLDAYTEFGLRQMLRVQMDVELDQVAGGSNLSELTFSLIQWAERHGQVPRLIEAAHEGNQENPQLVKLLVDAKSWFAEQDKSQRTPKPLHQKQIHRSATEFKESLRNWLVLVAALIALVGALAGAYATFIGGERGATILQMTVTARAVAVATEPAPIEPPEPISAGTLREFGDIPFVYVPEDDFWIMQTEVTNAMWQRFIDADGYNRESYWSDRGRQWREDGDVTEPRYWDNSDFNRPQQPVVGVSWYEAEAFTNWLSEAGGRPMQLPADEQWELACAGPDGRAYPWGDVPPPSEDLLNYSGNVGTTTEVGSYPAGTSPYGALDMAGNVWEWTESASLRGGSWNSNVNYVRCASRNGSLPFDRVSTLGFRVSSPCALVR